MSQALRTSGVVVTICLFLASGVLAGTVSSGRTQGRRGTQVEQLVYVEEEVDKMSRKFWRGIVNIVTGIGELPRQLVRSCHDSGPVAGVAVGLLNGVVMTPVRIGVGAVEVATFPIPMMPDGSTPVNATYGPMLKPAFVWQEE